MIRSIHDKHGEVDESLESLDASTYEALFAGENLLVLRRLERNGFRVEGELPEWFARIESAVVGPERKIDVCQAFLFLEHFLVDAEAIWQGGDTHVLRSDVWTQTLPSGCEISFTATARRIRGTAFLIISTVGVDVEERRKVLQKARELALAHERLLKEISKKEALLHCLVHDVSGPATSMRSCLELLASEPGLSETAREMIKVGVSESQRQQVLLHATLDIFSAELSALESYSTDYATAPDAVTCAHSVERQLEVCLVSKGVTLRVVTADLHKSGYRVTGDAEKLERVLYNLIENAIRYTPCGSFVTVRISSDDSSVHVTVEDEGPGVNPVIVDRLFGKFSQGPGSGGKTGLGLYFCRMMITRWGGEIGCDSLSTGGAKFWFRLPKPHHSAATSDPLETPLTP